jgi:inorganic triphosphatase YgiF
LKSGSEEAVVAFAAKLSQQYGLRPEKKSKFRRAMELAEGETV